MRLPDPPELDRRFKTAAALLFVLLVLASVAYAGGLVNFGDGAGNDTEGGLVPTDANHTSSPAENGGDGDGGNDGVDDGTEGGAGEDITPNGSNESQGDGSDRNVTPPVDSSAYIGSTTIDFHETTFGTRKVGTRFYQSPTYQMIEEGIVLVDAENEDSGQMRVRAYKRSGGFIHLVSVRGKGNSSRAVYLGQGEYKLRIEAQGEWRFTAGRPGEVDGNSNPVINESGGQSSVYGPFDSGGAVFEVRFEENEGEQVKVFVIDPYDGDVETVLEGEGPLEMETEYAYPYQHYLVVDTTSQDWRIGIEPES